jgi:Domain of unknown function (DUF4962)/Heparinase II/III-like protein
MILSHKSIALAFLAFTSWMQAETITDLKSWTIEGSVQMDPAKAAPSGAPSIKVDPKSKASIKLRDVDGSGKVSLYVYDDGKIARPDRQKSIGPRWGTSQADGRVLTGAIMYGGKLHPEGSLCLFDTNISQPRPWLQFKYLAPRGEPGWKKWEFEFHPTEGLKLAVNGKPVTQKYFDWASSNADGFNGIVLYGDDTEGTPQTIWIGDVNYELGPPMKVTPASMPTPTPIPMPTAKGPAPEEETEKSTEPPVLGKMTGFTPGPRLLDDLKNLRVPLVEGYASRHPRLLFTSDDRAALQKRALERTDLWEPVLASAGGVKAPVPSPQIIRSGAKYWQIERVLSASLAWFVTGEKEYVEGAVRWMKAHCKEGIWGDVYRPNLDLVASWYLYYIAAGYDVLKDQMSEEDRAFIRDGLALHARYMYLELDPHDEEKQIRWDQNHTYIPTVSLAAAALALLEDVPEARHWLTRSYASLRRSRYVLSEDGYYYEGFGYWTYALNWHARGAELFARATGEKLFEIPFLRDTWLFGLHLSLPGTPGVFGIGDGGSWKDGKLTGFHINNYSMLWEIAAQANSGQSRTVGDIFHARRPEKEYPSTAFLWFNPEVKPVALDQIEPFHYFPDQDVVAWRSGWDENASIYLFRCGPPLGHKAAGKFGQFKDWTMNGGHVHPEIGAFYIFAKGAYLAVDTGYTAEKWTKDHNTLLVDGKGQGMDGSYWNERGIPYADLDQARITSHFLSPEYGFASGEFGRVYKRSVSGVQLRRSLLMTKDWLLVVDDMEADQPRNLTWLCHSLAEFLPEGPAFVSRQANAGLAVIPLVSEAEPKPEPTVVMAGRGPGKGAREQRGFKMVLQSRQPVQKTRFVNLLVPLGSGEKAPTAQLVNGEGDKISLKVSWPGGRTEVVDLDLAWKQGGEVGPASIR